MARYFSRFRLEKEAINTVYSNIGNPMVTTRSYMLMEPLTMLIDPHWLRQGIISILPPEDEAYGIILNDSGIVPSNTMIAIVNPDTHTLCPSNVMGEIWVSSDSNVQTFYSMDDASHSDRFEATIVGSDPNVKYMRTGDLGFLWNVRRRIDNRAMHPMLEEGQCLFVLGPMCETLQRNGLVHFPFDIEVSIERCHPAIPSGGSVVFQVEDEAVAVVSIKSSEYALSVVPLVVNAILENHRFLIDTVVIVHPSNLARSRFGEKMRLKAMVGYKEKKLTAIYVKRITNQHDGVVLPQWNQSQFSLADFNNETGSIYTHQAPSISELSIDPENQPPFQLTRRDTQNSRQSHSNSGSIHSSTVTEPMRH